MPLTCKPRTPEPPTERPWVAHLRTVDAHAGIDFYYDLYHGDIFVQAVYWGRHNSAGKFVFQSFDPATRERLAKCGIAVTLGNIVQHYSS